MTRPIPPQRSDFSVFRPITTRWFDNDIYGHMNNTVHYQLFDTAVNGYLVETGVLDLKKSPTVFLVIGSGCNYFAELAFPDTIYAGVGVTNLGRSSVTYTVGLFREDDDVASAVGHFVHVNVDRETRKPVPIGDVARDILAQLQQ
ncbi:MAG: acyl-CoA thioesterase [Planktomarina sp.]